MRNSRLHQSLSEVTGWPSQTGNSHPSGHVKYRDLCALGGRRSLPLSRAVAGLVPPASVQASVTEGGEGGGEDTGGRSAVIGSALCLQRVVVICHRGPAPCTPALWDGAGRLAGADVGGITKT